MAVNNKKNHIYGWMFMPCTMWMYTRWLELELLPLQLADAVLSAVLSVYIWNALCPPHWHWHRVVFLAQLLHTIYYTHSGDMLKILVRRWRQRRYYYFCSYFSCSHPPATRTGIREKSPEKMARSWRQTWIRSRRLLVLWPVCCTRLHYVCLLVHLYYCLRQYLQLKQNFCATKR